jgi:hypothetical protein
LADAHDGDTKTAATTTAPVSNCSQALVMTGFGLTFPSSPAGLETTMIALANRGNRTIMSQYTWAAFSDSGSQSCKMSAPHAPVKLIADVHVVGAAPSGSGKYDWNGAFSAISPAQIANGIFAVLFTPAPGASNPDPVTPVIVDVWAEFEAQVFVDVASVAPLSVPAGKTSVLMLQSPDFSNFMPLNATCWFNYAGSLGRSALNITELHFLNNTHAWCETGPYAAGSYSVWINSARPRVGNGQTPPAMWWFAQGIAPDYLNAANAVATITVTNANPSSTTGNPSTTTGPVTPALTTGTTAVPTNTSSTTGSTTAAKGVASAASHHRVSVLALAVVPAMCSFW